MRGCQDVRIPDGSEGMGNSVGVSLSMDTAFALHRSHIALSCCASSVRSVLRIGVVWEDGAGLTKQSTNEFFEL